MFGLAVWDKALFLWLLSGMAVAALFVYPRQLGNAVTARNTVAAVLAFSLGALPLIYFNVIYPLETFRSNTHLDTTDIPKKVRLLMATADGSALFDYLVRDRAAGYPPRPPHSKLERVSVRILSFSGSHRRDLTACVFSACLVLLPFLWRTRAFKPCLFSLLVIVVAWTQMSLTKNAGGAAHHTILLWPLPILFIAVAVAQLSEGNQKLGGVLFYALLIAMVGSNLLVQNQYLSQIATYGSSAIWSDATYTLSSKLPLYAAGHVNILDWGMFDAQILLHRGKLPLRLVAENFLPGSTDSPQRAALFAEQDSIWLTHADAEQAYAGINRRFRQIAGESGYATVVVDTIYDRNGHSIYQLLRLEQMREK